MERWRRGHVARCRILEAFSYVFPTLVRVVNEYICMICMYVCHYTISHLVESGCWRIYVSSHVTRLPKIERFIFRHRVGASTEPGVPVLSLQGDYLVYTGRRWPFYLLYKIVHILSKIRLVQRVTPSLIFVLYPPVSK